MTWIATWDGVEYDIDPSEFTVEEMRQVKLMTGLSYSKLLTALPEMDPDAIKALFWVVKRREDHALKFSEFDGPPMKVFMAALAGVDAMADQLGKLLDGVGKMAPAPETTSTAGIPDSPFDAASPEPSITL